MAQANAAGRNGNKVIRSNDPTVIHLNTRGVTLDIDLFGGLILHINIFGGVVLWILIYLGGTSDTDVFGGVLLWILMCLGGFYFGY